MMKKTTQGKSGVVLPSVLALILCGVAIVSALVIHATRSMLLTRRSIDYQRASYLALAGLDAGTAFMKQAVYKTRNWGDYDIATVPQPDALIPDYDDEYETFISAFDDIKIRDVVTISRMIESSLTLCSERECANRARKVMSDHARRILNCLYKTEPEKFLSCFSGSLA